MMMSHRSEYHGVLSCICSYDIRSRFPSLMLIIIGMLLLRLAVCHICRLSLRKVHDLIGDIGTDLREILGYLLSYLTELLLCVRLQCGDYIRDIGTCLFRSSGGSLSLTGCDTFSLRLLIGDGFVQLVKYISSS